MQHPQTWQEFLERHLSSPQERQRIAQAIGVNPLTLLRWKTGESKPRAVSLQRFVAQFPEQQELLRRLLAAEFPLGVGDLAAVDTQATALTIPAELYVRVHHTLSTLPANLLFPSISDLILRHALTQLDPLRQGLCLIIASCMPPAATTGTIQSLREREGRGTAPWPATLEQAHAVFLGAESLVGHAVSTLHLELNLRLDEQTGLAPGYQATWEKSAVATPILHLGKVAGCLLVSSTRPEYFTPERCSLIEQYAELLAIIFQPEEFYDSGQIALRVMPFSDAQAPVLATFAERVIHTIRQAQQVGQPVMLAQAEQQVWQQMEQDLLTHVSMVASHSTNNLPLM